MVSLDDVKRHNASLKDFGPNLVAVFVGGTSGIGEATARAFVRDTVSSRVYLVGRNEAQASKIIQELRQLNPDGQISFVKCDAANLKSVDEVCKTIQQKENHINLLFMTVGIFTTKGRDETDEGLDKKFSLNYYSRMRFLFNLLPQLTAASKVDSATGIGLGHNLSRVVSVLSAGDEGPLNMDDLSLKNNFSLRNCARHTITMTSLSMEELAAAHPATSFVHAYPSAVKTGLTRGLGPIARGALEGIYFLAKPFFVPLDESGERHLYAATSPRFSPREAKDVADAAPGSDGEKGSGAYLLHWDGSDNGNKKPLQELRKNDTGKTVWKHTLDTFDSICDPS
ncbi:short-chain dehydrogenase/reductase [Penicillium manginii]|uniref:short-chain dehydrogenase/reductase n=1 Tax=Penicillium manginii TaxID=203109 RepID=UPI002547A10E|nr:short-chain dehydrogenase/reductase [Penicillium manginii]KAJ5744186.1 short-chain dehydrogenase/reductase [Penicillium manginii]